MSVRDRDDLLAELGERAAGALATALAPEPIAPSESLRDRVLASARPGARFEAFVARVAALLDAGQAHARALVERIDDPDVWEAAAPGVELFHIDGGPAVAHAITGFVRVAPGAIFPPHRHVGDEVVLVIQGGYRDSDGTEHGRGAEVPGAAGHEHHLQALDGPPLIYLAIVQEGVEIDGQLIPPGDPRA